MRDYQKFLHKLTDEALAEERRMKYHEWVDAKTDEEEEIALAKLEAAQQVEGERLVAQEGI